MASTVTPTWSDNIILLSDQVLARGSVISGTWDLSSKVAGLLFAALGRGGTTALTTSGLCLEVRRMMNGTTINHPAPQISSRVGSTPAASSTTVSTTSNSGQAVLTVASVSGFAAKDLICIQDSGGGVTRLEWGRVSKVSGSTLVLDANLQFTHTSGQADTVRNQSDIFAPIWLQGGAQYQIIFDYGAAGAGESITLRAMGQTYNYDTIS